MDHSHRFFENRDCRYFPCHEGLKDFNCLFCYCPFYLKEKCPGNPRYIERTEKRIKDCTGCTFPHRPENYEEILRLLKEG
ncbi:MAG: cysteine-rich small domain-containing protein [Blautia sp.]|nr:cysteine-rich small domain-containing protein [Blautia sp.]MCM1200683.1 cysteine-rich small domain-containing protein [Bacteroides fragilis]